MLKANKNKMFRVLDSILMAMQEFYFMLKKKFVKVKFCIMIIMREALVNTLLITLFDNYKKL